jgi:hypothetical protein
MTLGRQAKLWWQRRTGEDETPFDGDTPAWAVSMAFHVAVLLGLSTIVVPPEPDRPAAITIVQPLAEEPFREIEETVSEEPQETTGAESLDGMEVSVAVARELAPEPVVRIEAPDVPAADIRVDQPDEPLNQAPLLDADVSLPGVAVAEATSGAGGAVDRLTAEIRASLAQRPTVVCWVFDQSVSLAGQRREIAGRLETVFRQLAEGGEPGETELLNMVFAYGESVSPVMVQDGRLTTAGPAKPTREGADVVRAIREIPVDQSGMENTFTAVAEAALAARRVRISPRDRNVMIIVFTDERGNDEQRADEVAAFCRMNAMRVCVVGVPAPFGREQVQMRFVEYDTDRYAGDDQWPVVDQGPETRYPEFVRIAGGRYDDEPMDSGFGPFSLSKLCAETGGIYFCVHANRDTRGRVAQTAPMASRLQYFFDHEVMRAYRPDYVSVAKLDQQIAANRAKRGLLEAARMLAIEPMRAPRRIFPREDDGKLVQLFSDAQKEAAVLAPRIDLLYATLAKGLPDRPKVKEGRWRAGYDLALGRVLAAKIRTDAYNQILANAKAGRKFANPRNDTWELVGSDDVSNVGSANEKLARLARETLERVVREHPGTPWALFAADELQTPLGYAWRETYTGVNAPRLADGGGNGNPADDAQRRKLAPPKPPRPLKNL